MRTPDDLRPARIEDPSLRLEDVVRVDPALYRDLYSEVGREYRWTDRLAWTDHEIIAHLSDPAVSLHVLYDGDRPAGYFELKRERPLRKGGLAEASAEAGAIEIAYFGLLPASIGRGLGKHLLTLAVERAWREGASRVWLHTSTLDHPHALENYVKRGFRIVRREQYDVAP